MESNKINNSIRIVYILVTGPHRGKAVGVSADIKEFAMSFSRSAQHYNEIEESSPLRSLLIAFAIGTLLILAVLVMNTFAPVWFRIMFYLLLPLLVVLVVSSIKSGMFDKDDF